MRSVAFALILAGAFLGMWALFEERVREAERRAARVEYRFVPRSFYDEQLGQPDVTDKFASMFAAESVVPGRS